MKDEPALGTRIDGVVEVLLGMARLDFSRRLPIGEPDDPLAALSLGINMLAEELAATVASKRELEVAHRALKETQAQLMHAEKLAAIGKLAGGLAHEIGNPAAAALLAHAMMADRLTALDGSLAARGAATDDVRFMLGELRAVLSDAATGIERVRSVVQDLRIFSRVDDESHEAVDLDEVVRAACSLARSEIAARARLVLALGRPPPVVGSRGRLAQAVANLLANAIQALPVGQADRNEIRVETRRQGDEVLCALEDTGPGIPEAIRARIFEPFFTTKRADLGTGLGLAQAAEIVRKHHGRITLASGAGAGARFEIVLPVAPAAWVDARAPEPDRGGSTADGTPVRRARILVIDDDELILRTFSLVLELDHEVLTAADGALALALLARDRAFDVIFCDLVMPGTDGVVVYEAIRRQAPELVPRLVFCTGGAYTDRLRAFLSASAVPVLGKPFLPRQLAEMIERVRPAAPRVPSTLPG